LVATDAVAIAAGFNHSVIVKADGTVWTAGLNDSGQLGNNSTTPSTLWVQMSGIANGVAATAGDRHTVVLLADGTLMAAGINTSGQLGDNSIADLQTTAVPVYGLTDVTVIEAGGNHTIATTADGGMLVVAKYLVGAPAYTVLNATRIAEDGQRTDVAWPRGTRIELVGQAGKVYLNTKSSTTSSAKWVMDLQSGATLWNLPTDWQWRAAAPDGGAAVERSGELGYFDGAGQLLQTQSSTLFHPAHDSDSVIGSTDTGITAVVKPFANATRFGASYGAFSTVSSAEVMTGFGDRVGASAQFSPGIGIHMKAHTIFFDLSHMSIRVVPTRQEYWKNRLGGAMSNTDTFGNHFFTFGAGPGASDAGACSGTLTSERNRTNDAGAYAWRLEKLQYSPFLEDQLIQSLWLADLTYPDALAYACFPENNPGYYNSNSYAIGLIDAVGILTCPVFFGPPEA